MRGEIVAAARRWLGTPYHHQGRLKGVGCDCLGLIASVGQELGLTTFDSTDYAAQPDGATLESNCNRYLVTRPEDAAPRAGDVALFWIEIRRLPQHLAIFVPWDERTGIIHAHMRFGEVKQHAFDEFWSKRLVRIYSYPGVD
jgi:NlpC/P60 family putative phage cell wall peptidase